MGLVAQLRQHEHLGAVGTDGDGILCVRQEHSIRSPGQLGTRRATATPPLSRRLRFRRRPGQVRGCGRRRGSLRGHHRRLVRRCRHRLWLGQQVSLLGQADDGQPGARAQSMPTSRAAASAIPSCPLPPSTTIRSGNRQASRPRCLLSASRARRNRRDSTSYIDAKSSFRGCPAPPRREPVGAVARPCSGLPSTNTTIEATVCEPLDVRDVVTLDHPRQPGQPQPFLQLGQHHLGVLAGVAPAAEADLRRSSAPARQVACAPRAVAPAPPPLRRPGPAARISVSHSAFSSASAMGKRQQHLVGVAPASGRNTGPRSSTGSPRRGTPAR